MALLASIVVTFRGHGLVDNLMQVILVVLVTLQLLSQLAVFKVLEVAVLCRVSDGISYLVLNRLQISLVLLFLLLKRRRVACCDDKRLQTDDVRLNLLHYIVHYKGMLGSSR